jgi:hypothetical protein
VLSIPSPGASISAGNVSATVALARVVNEVLGQFCKVHPQQFSFVAVVPLPYADVTVREVGYPILKL